MTNIRNYVDCQISIEAARMAVLGFNKPLFLFESDALDRTNEVSTSDYDAADLGGESSELYKAFQTYLSQEVIAPVVVIGCKKSTDATYGAAIDAIRTENDSWYVCVTLSKVKADILAVAAKIETIDPGKIHCALTAEADVINAVASNTALELKTAGYYRTALVYSSDTAAYANAAQASYFSFEPGSITFNYKELRTVKAESLTAQQRANLIDQNCQYQAEVRGLKRLLDSGMVSSGEWIDTMLGIDWLTARMSEGVFGILATAPKVPYTKGGAAVVETEMKRNLAVASDDPYNFINDDYTTSAPNPRAASSADRAGRKLGGFTFTATPQGAIHIVGIRGKLVV